MHLLVFLLWLFRLAVVAQHDGEQKLDESQNSVDAEYNSISTYLGPLSFSEKRLYYPTTRNGTACRTRVAKQRIPGEDVAAYLFRRELGKCRLLDCSEWTDFVAAICCSASSAPRYGKTRTLGL